jgi:hypothetical protein
MGATLGRWMGGVCRLIETTGDTKRDKETVDSAGWRQPARVKLTTSTLALWLVEASGTERPMHWIDVRFERTDGRSAFRRWVHQAFDMALVCITARHSTRSSTIGGVGTACKYG